MQSKRGALSSWGCWFSVNASSVRRHVLRLIPLDRLLTETDHPFGDRRNGKSARPGNVAIAEHAIGAQHDLDASAVRSRIWANPGDLVGQARCASMLPPPIRLQLIASSRP